MIKGLVSIIIPVYNVEKYLRPCLDSILAQTYANIEIILIDDGSKDSSGAICDEYAVKDNRIRVVHKENGGVSKARNVGIDCAQGEYLSFIDGDDTVDPDYIGLMYKEIERGPYDIVRLSWERGGRNYTYDVRFDEDGKKVVDESAIDDLHLCANIWGLFRAGRHIRFNESLKNGEDSLFVIENFIKSEHQRMLLMDKPWYHYTVVEKSASEMSAVERLEAHQLFLKQVLCFRDLFPRLDFLVKKHEYSDYFSLMCDMIDRNVSNDNGYELKDIQKKVIALRKEGAKYPNYKDEMKYFLYRYRFRSFFRCLKFIQCKLKL